MYVCVFIYLLYKSIPAVLRGNPTDYLNHFFYSVSLIVRGRRLNKMFTDKLLCTYKNKYMLIYCTFVNKLFFV